jgi:hypothetical protein
MTVTKDLRTTLQRFTLLALVIFTVGYAAFRAYPLVAGPKITVYSPVDGDTVASTTFEISGQVLRAKEITIQGKPITIDTEGHFTETLVASSPYTILVLVATDKYGATVKKTLRVTPN